MNCPACGRPLDDHTPSQLVACKQAWDTLQEKEAFKRRKIIVIALLLLIILLIAYAFLS
jgi:uncharacterized membrane protein YvbJ